MERSEIEKLARDTAERTVKLAKAEWSLDLERERNSLRDQLRNSTQELKDLIHEVTSGPVSGIPRDDHVIQHQKIDDFLQTASDLKKDVVKRVIGYVFIGVISAAVTTYLGSEDRQPVIPKSGYHADPMADWDTREDEDED